MIQDNEMWHPNAYANSEQPILKERIVATHFIEVYSTKKHEPKESCVCTNSFILYMPSFDKIIGHTAKTYSMETIAIFKIKIKT